MTTLANQYQHTYAGNKPRSGRRPPSRGQHARTPSHKNSPAGETIKTRDGSVLSLRTIHIDDVAALQRGFAQLTPGEIRMRFLHPLTELPEPLAQRLCDLDPDCEIAFVLVDPLDTIEPEIHAVARAHFDPVTLAAEFALVVQHRYGGQGFGTLLMQRLIAACRTFGATQIWGDVLLENGAMLELCHELGFERRSQLHDPGVVRVTLDLDESAPRSNKAP
jgi:GNAT superfamily N-acetyltransferase